jgi:tRNA nucleotidyltransferase (CCA-adding enzyme)
MKFLEQVKKELMPDVSVLKDVNSFIENLNGLIKKNKLKATCVPGGSVAKGTFLKDDFDVDLFVKFNYSYKDKDISKLLEGVLKKYNYERLHGSRDYFQIKDKSINYELVPVLDVKKPELAENVTDMSPMHVDWVKKNLKKGQDDEIRLTKKFCKAAEVYGAESYIRGFSGHTIDILVIQYGSFINLLKAAVKWKAPTIIDVEKYYRNSQDVLFSMNQSKIEGPMIIVDPILKTRNAASAISYEKFALFRKKAAEFLKKPSEKFFEEPEIGKTYLRKKFKKNLFIITLEAKEGKKDVIGSKILKAFKFMKSEITKIGFKIKNSGWTWNNRKHVLFWFVIDNLKLPDKKIIEGPPVEMEEFAEDFRKKYKKCFVKKKKLFAEITVKQVSPEDAIKQISKKEYFLEKIKLLKTEKYDGH